MTSLMYLCAAIGRWQWQPCWFIPIRAQAPADKAKRGSMGLVELMYFSLFSFQNRAVMAGKFAAYLVINVLIFGIPGASYKVFWPFQFILNVSGKLDYWVFTST